MKQTSLQGIANKATQDKTYRFRNLFGMLTVGYLFWCDVSTLLWTQNYATFGNLS